MQGILLGNPLLSEKINGESRVDYFYSHGFIGRPLYEKLKSCYSDENQPGCYTAVSLYINVYTNKIPINKNYC